MSWLSYYAKGTRNYQKIGQKCHVILTLQKEQTSVELFWKKMFIDQRKRQKKTRTPH